MKLPYKEFAISSEYNGTVVGDRGSVVLCVDRATLHSDSQVYVFLISHLSPHDVFQVCSSKSVR
jgi:hypothetical protein